MCVRREARTNVCATFLNARTHMHTYTYAYASLPLFPLLHSPNHTPRTHTHHTPAHTTHTQSDCNFIFFVLLLCFVYGIDMRVSTMFSFRHCARPNSYRRRRRRCKAHYTRLRVGRACGRNEKRFACVVLTRVVEYACMCLCSRICVCFPFGTHTRTHIRPPSCRACTADPPPHFQRALLQPIFLSSVLAFFFLVNFACSCVTHRSTSVNSTRYAMS